MPSSYPGALDTLNDLGSTLNGPPTHTSVHTAANDAIEAVQAELGTNPSGSAATVAARLSALDTTVSNNASTAAAASAAAAQGVLAVDTYTGNNTAAAGFSLSATFTAATGRYYRISARISASGTGDNWVALSNAVSFVGNAGGRSLDITWVGTFASGGSKTVAAALGITAGHTVYGSGAASPTVTQLVVEDLGAV